MFRCARDDRLETDVGDGLGMGAGGVRWLGLGLSVYGTKEMGSHFRMNRQFQTNTLPLRVLIKYLLLGPM